MRRPADQTEYITCGLQPIYQRDPQIRTTPLLYLSLELEVNSTMPRIERYKNFFGRSLVRRKYRGAKGSEDGLRIIKGGDRGILMGISREAPDALLLSLSILAESADVCPPLKSVLGALNFIVSQIQVSVLSFICPSSESPI